MNTKNIFIQAFSLIVLLLSGCEKENITKDERFLKVDVSSSITFLAKDNVAQQIEVVTNLEQWNVVSDKAWCQVLKTEKGFTVTAADNMLLETQNATITISGDGVSPILLSVMQAAKSAGTKYAFDVPDFSESNVYKVLAGTNCIAEVVREYLYLENQLDVQVVTVYLTDKNGVADLSKGFVTQITQKGSLDNSKLVGGSITFDKKKNAISLFTNGNQESQNSISIDIEKSSINFANAGELVNTAKLQPDRVVDIEGNTYPIAKIGTQYWMAENLKTTKYNDGHSIMHAPEASQWNKAADNRAGAYCVPMNNPDNKKVYGLLYNAYAMGYTRDMEDLQNDKLSPKGWKIPSGWKLQIDAIYVGTPLAPESDMDRLMRYLQGSKENGASPKMRNPKSWRPKIVSDPPYGNNLSLFSAAGSGFRSYDLRGNYNDGDFVDFQHIEGWWCSTIPLPKEEGLVHYQVDAASIWGTNVDLDPTYQDKGLGLSIRCLRK
ncbi:MAG: FISUMP domain-containing protein [Bacteroides sp.]